jgi:hypothetical protein
MLLWQSVRNVNSPPQTTSLSRIFSLSSRSSDTFRRFHEPQENGRTAYYFARLPRHVAWTCDPSGKNERLELKKAGFNVRKGINDKAFGINLVTRWLRSGRLKIVRSLCPNLCSEAPRYRYAGAKDGLPQSEEPVNEFNHGMDALRYRFSLEPPPPPLALPATAASPPGPGDAPTVPPAAPAPTPARKPRPWCRIDNEAVWTRIC